MRAMLVGLAVLLVTAVVAPSAHANPWGYPWPCAPGACYPSAYAPNQCGCLVPFYCLRPPFPPFNGLLVMPPKYPSGFAPAYVTALQAPALIGGGGEGWTGTPVFPTHPFSRSPRDFFMYGQNLPEF